MKRLLIIVAIMFFFIKCSKKLYIEVPWFINEEDNVIAKYNYKDSLIKYEVYNKTQFKNKANYYSYLSNLIILTDSTQTKEAIKYLEKSQISNKLLFCNELIKPTLNYITSYEVQGKKECIPFLLNLDFEYFLLNCLDCGFLNENSEKEQINLKLSFLMILDQWYRVPMRKWNSHKQLVLDSRVRSELESEYKKDRLNFIDVNTREKIFTILLHSTDCEWSNRWLKIYIKNYRGQNEYVKHLNHYIFRSSCLTEDIRKYLSEEIMNYDAK